MSVAEIRQNAREIRARLRRPPNAVMDMGIDLKRKKQPTIPLYAVVKITELEPPKPVKVTLAMVLEATGDYYSFGKKEIIEPNRTKRVSLARHIVFYLTKKLTKIPGSQVCFHMNRDHTCGIGSVKKISSLIESDPTISQAVYEIEQRIISGNYS